MTITGANPYLKYGLIDTPEYLHCKDLMKADKHTIEEVINFIKKEENKYNKMMEKITGGITKYVIAKQGTILCPEECALEFFGGVYAQSEFIHLRDLERLLGRLK